MQTILINLKRNRIGLDIGGSLAKMALYYPKNYLMDNGKKDLLEYLETDSRKVELDDDETLYLKKWKTGEIDTMIDFIEMHDILE